VVVCDRWNISVVVCDRWNISVVVCDEHIRGSLSPMEHICGSLWPMEHIRGSLWPIYSVTVNHELNLTIQSLCSVAFSLSATYFQGHYHRNHKLCNTVSTERYILHMQVLLHCCCV
jgi:hypothetical protein